MKHSNGLKWHMNVVLNASFAFKCFIIKDVIKLQNENRKPFATTKLCTLFTGHIKLWQKSETKYLIVFILKLVLLKQA